MAKQESKCNEGALRWWPRGFGEIGLGRAIPSVRFESSLCRLSQLVALESRRRRSRQVSRRRKKRRRVFVGRRDGAVVPGEGDSIRPICALYDAHNVARVVAVALEQAAAPLRDNVLCLSSTARIRGRAIDASPVRKTCSTLAPRGAVRCAAGGWLAVVALPATFT